MTDVPGIGAPDHAAAIPAVDTRAAPTGTGELGRSWRDGEPGLAIPRARRRPRAARGRCRPRLNARLEEVS
jgi:hypothetical protein